MSVTEHTPISTATGDGVSSAAGFAFPVLDEEDLKVKVAGVLLTLNVDYTVSGVGNPAGGTVTFTSPPADGSAISMYRESVLQRETDYQVAGDFRAETVNPDFDRLWLVAMEMLFGSRGSAASMRAPIGEVLAEMPARSARASKVAAFNSSGDPIAVAPGDDASGLETRLQNTLDAADGAGMVAYSPIRAYASGTVGGKLLQSLSVKDYGAVGDGVTDDTSAIQAAVDAIPFGGILLIPSGAYVLSDEIVLHAGISVVGEGAADFVFGSPPAYASMPTMLVQTAPAKACFRIGGGQHGISIRNIAFSPVVSVTYPAVESPATDGKCGILLTSSTRVTAPIPDDNGHIWGLELSGLTFYHLHYGIKVTDPNAGDTGAGAYPYDWSVAPALLSNLRFIYPKVGIYLNTSNADAWVLTGCHFNIPSAGDGLALYRWGMLRLTNCFAGSNAVSLNRFINIYDNGTTNGVEDIVLDSCQSETLTHLLNVQGNASPVYRYKITCRNCVAELTSEVYLGSPCHFVSESNRWTTQVYVANANVRVSSANDFFTGAFKFQFLAGSADTCFVNFLPGPDTSSEYLGLEYINGRVVRRTGSTSVPNAAATTLFTLPATAGAYAVYAYIAAGGSVYMRTSRVAVDGVSVVLLGGEGGAGMVLSVSGLDVLATQNSGVTQSVAWGYAREI